MTTYPNEIEQRIAEQRVFHTSVLEIGRFRARPEDQLFRCSGAPGRHLFVFPRTSVAIHHLGREPFHTDLNTVTFYNPDQVYFRQPVSPQGDLCDWFALSPEVLFDLMARRDLDIDPQGEQIFRFPFSYVSPRAFLAERQLWRTVRQGAEPLWVEEVTLGLAEQILSSATALRQVRSRSPRVSSCGSAAGVSANKAHHRLAQRARALIDATFTEEHKLSELAQELHCSVFHLSRVFRAQVGSTLHAYRNQLRLRAALDLALAGSAARLVDIAFEVGFSSHSHFTAAFRATFGLTPSQASKRDLHELRASVST